MTITDLDTLRQEAATWLGQSYSFDLETSGLDFARDRMVGVALSFADGRHYYVVIEHTVAVMVVQDNMIDTKEETYLKLFMPRSEVMRLLQPLFAQEDVVAVAHNAKFDLHFLIRAGIDFRCQLRDTMLAAQIVDENRKVGLKLLAGLVDMPFLQNYSALPHYPGFHKDEILGVPLDVVAHYAMDDTEATFKLWQHLEPLLDTEGVADCYYTIWMPLLFALQEMEARGIVLDMEQVRQQQQRYVELAKQAEISIWREGVQMVIEKVVALDNDWQQLPDYYLMPLHKLDEPWEKNELTFWLRGGEEVERVVVRDVALPVFCKYRKDGTPSRAFQPRIPWFNPGSSTQLRELLFDKYGLKEPEDIELDITESGNISLNKDTLRVLRYELGENAPAVLDHILVYRKASKLLSTYFRTYVEKADEREHYALRTNFNQAVTDTGRLSSSGPNLQNQPARGEEGTTIRNLFIARPGYKLVVADYNAMELRIAANFSQEPKMIQAFREGRDLHSLTAAGQMGMEYEDFVAAYDNGDPDCKRGRFIGKTSNFGLLYGMGGPKFQRLLLVDAGIKVSTDEAWQLIEDFQHTYPVLYQWKCDMKRWILNHEYVPTIRGRKRRFPGIELLPSGFKNSALRQGINAYIQGSCADIICEVIPAIQDQFRYLEGSLLLQVHDELVGEVPEEHAALAAKLMAKMMVESVNGELTVPLVAESGVGDTWASAK